MQIPVKLRGTPVHAPQGTDTHHGKFAPFFLPVTVARSSADKIPNQNVWKEIQKGSENRRNSDQFLGLSQDCSRKKFPNAVLEVVIAREERMAIVRTKQASVEGIQHVFDERMISVETRESSMKSIQCASSHYETGQKDGELRPDGDVQDMHACVKQNEREIAKRLQEQWRRQLQNRRAVEASPSPPSTDLDSGETSDHSEPGAHDLDCAIRDFGSQVHRREEFESLVHQRTLKGNQDSVHGRVYESMKDRIGVYELCGHESLGKRSVLPSECKFPPQSASRRLTETKTHESRRMVSICSRDEAILLDANVRESDHDIAKGSMTSEKHPQESPAAMGPCDAVAKSMRKATDGQACMIEASGQDDGKAEHAAKIWNDDAEEIMLPDRAQDRRAHARGESAMGYTICPLADERAEQRGDLFMQDRADDQPCKNRKAQLDSSHVSKDTTHSKCALSSSRLDHMGIWSDQDSQKFTDHVGKWPANHVDMGSAVERTGKARASQGRDSVIEEGNSSKDGSSESMEDLQRDEVCSDDEEREGRRTKRGYSNIFAGKARSASVPRGVALGRHKSAQKTSLLSCFCIRWGKEGQEREDALLVMGAMHEIDDQ